MPTSTNGPSRRSIADCPQQLARVVEHHLRHLGAVDPPRHDGQVQRHHLVSDELVDHREREQDVLGRAVEAAQQLRRLGCVAAVEPRREPAQVREQHAREHRHPAGRRQLDTRRAHRRVLARRPVAERPGDEAAGALERRRAERAPGAARHRAEQQRHQPAGTALVQPPRRLPVVGLERLAVALSGLAAQGPNAHALPSGEPRALRIG